MADPMPRPGTLIVAGMDFEVVYRTNFAVVWRSLRHFGVAAADAQDLTQEVFLIACRRLDEFERRSTLKTWLIGIAYHLAANYRRSSVHREVPAEPFIGGLSSALDVERQLEQRDDLRQLERLLLELPLEQRAVFTMFEIEGLSGDEIAEALDVPVGTVRSRLRLARQAFVVAAGRGDESMRLGAWGSRS
jgi:RNA polymerase sigma-70 factor, ECF subfamily